MIFNLDSVNVKDSFNNEVQKLASRHYFFTIIKTHSLVGYPSLKRVWLDSQKYKVILARKKFQECDSNLYIGRNLRHLLESLE